MYRKARAQKGLAMLDQASPPLSEVAGYMFNGMLSISYYISGKPARMDLIIFQTFAWDSVCLKAGMSVPTFLNDVSAMRTERRVCSN